MIGPSYNIIASTKVKKIEHPAISSLLKRGYYKIDELDRLFKFDYMRKHDVFNTPTVIYPPNLMDCPFIIKTFLRHGTTRYFLILYYINSVPEKSDLELFDILSTRLEESLKNYLPDSASHNSLLEVFLEDLICKTYENEEYLRDRACFLNLNMEGCYRLGIIKLKNYKQQLAEYLLMRIRTSYSSNRYRIMLFKKSILLLVILPKSTFDEEETFHEKLKELKTVLHGYQAAIGLSNQFKGLININAAYSQCRSAIKYGWMLAPEQTTFYYSKYYIYEMLDACKSSLPIDSMYVQKLKLLDDPNDYQHSNLLLLKIFLMTERSITATAKALFMHRNSVIYRVNKIQEILKISLDDPDVRLRLLISFKILDMIHGKLDQDAIEKLGLSTDAYNQE